MKALLPNYFLSNKWESGYQSSTFVNELLEVFNVIICISCNKIHSMFYSSDNTNNKFLNVKEPLATLEKNDWWVATFPRGSSLLLKCEKPHLCCNHIDVFIKHLYIK